MTGATAGSDRLSRTSGVLAALWGTALLSIATTIVLILFVSRVFARHVLTTERPPALRTLLRRVFSIRGTPVSVSNALHVPPISEGTYSLLDNQQEREPNTCWTMTTWPS